ncbi:MAG: site-specific integrase [Anaerosomatales bacterium]|nr:site-specific integrase [Anaerosomatales bacterium]
MTPPSTFADAWHAWLRYRACGQRPLRLSTLADYESIYRCHLGSHLGDVPLAEIDGTVIAGLVVTLSATGMRPKRLANVLVPVRACLRWHHRMGAFPRDPTPWFDASAPLADERRILTIEQVERLIAAIPAFYRPLVTFAAYTGVRLGELRALTWPDLDLEARTARIDKTYYRNRLQRSTKSGYDRTVPIPAHVADNLRAWRAVCPSAEDGPLFPNKSGRLLDADTFRASVWRPAVRSAGLPETVRIHDLRHTSASLYLQHGATVREVMDIHGWRQMQTALRYLHTADTLNAAADRLSAARDAALG